MKVRVKICGVTTAEDACVALEAGAEALGLNFVAASPRYLRERLVAQEIARLARAKDCLAVGVFANESAATILKLAGETSLDVVQLHGDENSELGLQLREQSSGALQIWKAFRVATSEDVRKIEAQSLPYDALLFDAHVRGRALGGTGTAFDWSILDGFVRTVPLVLAGGLHPGNVAEAVKRVKPDWVDTASGVESTPGRKDPSKVRNFVEFAHGAGV